MAQPREDRRVTMGDARLTLGWLMLLGFGIVWRPMMVLAFVLLVVGAGVAVVRYRVRERRFEKNPPPFWADEL